LSPTQAENRVTGCSPRCPEPETSSNGGSLFAASNPWLFAVTGFLGCYTTVSSFSLQTLALARDGEAALAIGNVVLSVLLCLGAVAGGFAAVGFFR